MESLLNKNIGKLGFGFMRLPQLGGGFDTEQVDKMVDLFMENGYSYFDTAYTYDGAEEALQKSLVRRYPREKFTVATKLNLLAANTKDAISRMFETSLKQLGVDYVDFYMLHGIGDNIVEKVEALGAWDYIAGLKAEGRVRHIGFSFHGSPECLNKILDAHPESEFVQLQINYLDWDSQKVQSKRLYEIARAHDKPIIIMEPVKGGMLASEDSPAAKIFKAANPDVSTASWAVRFAASLPGVLVMLSGMSSISQMQDNLSTMNNLSPLSDSEMILLKKAKDALNAIPRVPCTECKYCVDNCPQNINIPMMMELYSDYLVHQTTSNIDRIYHLFAGPSNAGDCIACKVCEEHCPQKIEISDTLSKLSVLMD